MVVTNSGGPGVMAADAAVADGLQLSELSDARRTSLDDVLPVHWSRGNPIDILGDRPGRPLSSNHRRPAGG